MIATLRRTVLTVLVIACTMATAVAAARATPGEPTTLRVQGTQIMVSENVFKSHGGLLGDFWILTFVPLYESASLVIGTGTERFVGCVDVDRDSGCEAGEPSGELRFDYIQWTTFDPSTGVLVEGNCVHPVTGGDGDFHGARGLVTMNDVVVGGDVRTTYEGTVVLNAAPADAPAAHASAAQSAAELSPASRGRC